MEQNKNWIEEFIEKGADLEHDRWAKWQKYLHSLCTIELKDGTFEETGRLIIEADRVQHWDRQINTLYSELSEKEKEYDREEVRKYLPLIKSLLSQATEEALAKERARIVERIQKMKGGACSIGMCGHDNLEPNSVNHGEYLGKNQALTDAIDIINNTKQSDENL